MHIEMAQTDLLSRLGLPGLPLVADSEVGEECCGAVGLQLNGVGPVVDEIPDRQLRGKFCGVAGMIAVIVRHDHVVEHLHPGFLQNSQYPVQIAPIVASRTCIEEHRPSVG